MTIKENFLPYNASAPVEDPDDIPLAEAVMVNEAPPPPHVPHREPEPPQHLIHSNHEQQPQPAAAAPKPTSNSVSNNSRKSTTTTITRTYKVPAPAPQPQQQAPRPTVPLDRVVNLPGLTNQVCRIRCPYCNQEGITRTRGLIDGCTIAGIILLFFFFFPLFWLPFVCACCKTTEHFCTKCHRRVGTAPPCSC